MSVFDQSRRVRITAALDELPVIEVDGLDLAPTVEAYRITQVPGKAPEVTLFLKPGWKGLDLDVLAEVSAEPADLRHVVVDFLNAVDAQKLDEAVFAREDLDGRPGELTRGLLSQLKEWAASA
ncbi:hypothetical protein [Streptomyces goshikiensis]|uniref:hypothetical protein n=1 Tax=Streptomyces goshikiensis TaxID=1942 RepID=UPI003798C406